MNQQQTNVNTERWIRIPRPKEREPNTGLSRATLHHLIAEGKVKSSSLRRAGTVRGVRLIWLPSLLEYIERHAVQPKGGAE